MIIHVMTIGKNKENLLHKQRKHYIQCKHKMNIQMIHFIFCQHNREIGKDERKTNDFQRLFSLQKTFKFLLQDLSINVIIFKIYKQSQSQIFRCNSLFLERGNFENKLPKPFLTLLKIKNFLRFVNIFVT